jgi:hypothetical protein
VIITALAKQEVRVYLMIFFFFFFSFIPFLTYLCRVLILLCSYNFLFLFRFGITL